MKFYSIFLFLILNKIIFGQLRGNAITCNDPNGTELDIKTVSGGAITKQPCVRCTCQFGSVNCTIDDCPDLKSCPLAEKPPAENSSSICCPKCRTCNYLGIQRINNERWKSVQDPCYALTCKAGIVTSSQIQCTNHCKDGLNDVPGFCCQLCKKSIENKNDPCLQCDFVMGIWYHCYRLACPVLDCPNNLIKQIPNKCCPECIHPSPREYRTTVPQNPRIQGYCIFQLRRYEIGDFWHHDPCTRCHCQSGGIQCRRFTCPIRQCHKSAKLLFRKNICCPFCGYSISKNESNIFTNYGEFRSEKIIVEKQNFGIENSGKITTCIHKLPNGNVLIRKHNSFWKANDCLNCYCRLGKTKCEKENCFPQEPFTCPKGSKKIKLIGKCCKFCEQYESTCTIFDGSNYETFDGLNFTFNGNKSYVLTQECGFDDENEIDGDEQLPNFSVIAHNIQNVKNEEIYTGRISILLKIQNSQRPLILQIGNKVFTENDRPIQIPKNTSIYSIENVSENLQLNIPLLGLKLKFDGKNFVELTLLTMHKGKVCGLCGNFNDRESDDLWPKYSDSVTENIEQFAASWKWKTAKINHYRCKSTKLTAEKADELSECKRLLDNKFFAFCRKQIHVHQYIRQCTKDVCECSSHNTTTTTTTTEKPCYCHSIEAFATQCANRFIWGQWTQILSQVRQFPVHPKCDKIRRPA